MGDLWAVGAALGTVVLPMALAWWLLGRPPSGGGSRHEPHGKIPRVEER